MNLTTGVDWKNLHCTNPPFEPELVNLNCDQSKTVPLDEIFEKLDPTLATSPACPKVKSRHIENVRLDILHEENLNGLVEIA